MNITITEIQEIIKTAFKNKFSKVTVDSYDSDSNLHELAPACLLSLEEFEKGTDAGDGKYPAKCLFSVHCILGQELDNTEIELQELAIAVSQFVSDDGIWTTGSVVKPAKNIEAFPGNFKKGTDNAYSSWVVSWTQTIYIGSSKWSEDETRSGIKLAVNPVNDDQPQEYNSLEVGDA